MRRGAVTHLCVKLKRDKRNPETWQAAVEAESVAIIESQDKYDEIEMHGDR